MGSSQGHGPPPWVSVLMVSISSGTWKPSHCLSHSCRGIDSPPQVRISPKPLRTRVKLSAKNERGQDITQKAVRAVQRLSQPRLPVTQVSLKTRRSAESWKWVPRYRPLGSSMMWGKRATISALGSSRGKWAKLMPYVAALMSGGYSRGCCRPHMCILRMVSEPTLFLLTEPHQLK